jgi:hypothetical protein
MANVVLRGVSERAWQVRNNVKVAAGDSVQREERDLPRHQLVGRFPNTAVGQSMHFAGRPWEVVCHFTAGGSRSIRDLGRE